MHRRFGFSLVELLVAVAMLGILSMISIPLYSQYVIKARRFQAESTLAQLSAAMERYHLERNTYEGADLAALHAPTTIANGHYQLRIQAATAQAFSVAAAPQGAQAKSDSGCGILAMNDKGEKAISGTGTVQACW